jgi:CRISPR-associated protein Cmr2
VFKEYGWPGDPDAWGRRNVQPLYDELGEPHPYVACLVADGDHMGRAIDGLDSPEAHRRLSRSLAAFARRARDIVEQDHLGSLVYAGGDDVLAFLPLPTAMACAASLRAAFDQLVDAGAARPTLSAGIGVGHAMDGMGDLLDLGRQAERLAKDGGRDSLAVLVDKRSGETRRWGARWDSRPAERLAEDVRLLGVRLPLAKVYEVDRTLRRLPLDAGDADWARVLVREVRRTLARAQAGEAALQPGDVGIQLDDGGTYAELREEVATWLERMLVARTFAMAEVAG